MISRYLGPIRYEAEWVPKPIWTLWNQTPALQPEPHTYPTALTGLIVARPYSFDWQAERQITNGEKFGRKSSRSNEGCVEGLKKPTRDPSQSIRYPVRDSNITPLEHDFRALLLHQPVTIIVE